MGLNALNHVGWTRALQNVFWGVFWSAVLQPEEQISIQKLKDSFPSSLLENAGHGNRSRIREERWFSWAPGKRKMSLVKPSVSSLG